MDYGGYQEVADALLGRWTEGLLIRLSLSGGGRRATPMTATDTETNAHAPTPATVTSLLNWTSKAPCTT